MRVVFLAYYLRNLGGHNLKGIDILIQRYEEIRDSMIDAFFVSINPFYPILETSFPTFL